MAVDKMQQPPESIESGGIMDFLREKTGLIAKTTAAILAFQVSTAQAEEQKSVQVADVSGKIVLANVETSNVLSESDIQSGIQELTAGFMRDGDTEDDAREYARETITAFLEGNNDGGAEYIAKFAPSFTDKALSSLDRNSIVVIQLDSEVKKLNIAKSEENIAKSEENIAKSEENIARDEEQIARLKKLGKNIDNIIEQSN